MFSKKHIGCRKISKIIPVSETVISGWIRIFVAQNPDYMTNHMRAARHLRKEDKHTQPSYSSDLQDKVPSEPSSDNSSSTTPVRTEEGVTPDIKSLLEENRQLKRLLDHETMRADAYNKMIDIAEERFKISIRKKPGAKR